MVYCYNSSHIKCMHCLLVMFSHGYMDFLQHTAVCSSHVAMSVLLGIMGALT